MPVYGVCFPRQCVANGGFKMNGAELGGKERIEFDAAAALEMY